MCTLKPHLNPIEKSTAKPTVNYRANLKALVPGHVHAAGDLTVNLTVNLTMKPTVQSSVNNEVNCMITAALWCQTMAMQQQVPASPLAAEQHTCPSAALPLAVLFHHSNNVYSL